MNLAARQWRESFADNPSNALDRLIRGLVPLGTLSQLSLGELFSTIFDHDDSEFDGAVSEWLDRQILSPVPSRIIPSVISKYFCATGIVWF